MLAADLSAALRPDDPARAAPARRAPAKRDATPEATREAAPAAERGTQPGTATTVRKPVATVAASTAAADPQQRSPRSRRRPAARRSTRKAPTTPAVRYTSPASAPALASDLGFMLDAKTRGGQWGAIVVSLTRGDTLYARNADLSMLPASTMKLMTAAVALERFGAEHQFSTDVLRDGQVDAAGTLTGSLYLRGDGDPGFSNRYLRGDANVPVTTLARLIAESGIRRVNGDIVGDASAFDAKKVPDGWLTRYLQAGYAARVSPLSLNENLVWIAAYPGAGKGPARVVLEPASDAQALVSTVKTVPGSSGGKVRVSRRPDGTIAATGWIGSRSIPRKYSLVIEEPALFTAGSLRAALEAQGVTVDGAVRLGATPAGAERVASLPSQPLSRLVSAMNRESINIFAELLFRNAARGKERETIGSAETGNALLQDFLRTKVGVPAGAVVAADGSGLSTLDRVTPRAMAQLLAHAHQAPWADAFHASLPVAGESELLRNRMKFTPAHGNLHAKTGTTNTVISLAGYVTAKDGEVLAFVFIYNGNDRWNARTTIDVMGATLAGFSRD